MADKERLENQVERENATVLLEERVKCDKLLCTIKLCTNYLEIVYTDGDDTPPKIIAWTDVLKVEKKRGDEELSEELITLHYIENLGHVKPDKKGIRWNHKEISLSLDDDGKDDIGPLVDKMLEILNQIVESRPGSLLFLINPKSGDGKAEHIYNTSVVPIMKLMNVTTEEVVMESVSHTREILNEYDFSKIDGIIIMGGDGTICSVINTIVLRCQREAQVDVNKSDVKLQPVNIKIGVIPAGTGQGDSLTLNGSFDPETAALHIVKGETMQGDLVVAHNNDKWVSSSILAVGVGYFANHQVHSETKRWLGSNRYFIAFLQTLWNLRSFEATVEALKVGQSGEEEWEKISDKFIEIDVWLGRIGTGRWFPGFLECHLQSETSRLQAFKYTAKLANADASLYEMPHLKALKTQAIRLTLPHIEQRKQPAEETRTGDGDGATLDVNTPGSILHTDGEVFPITDPVIHIRLHRQILTFFGRSRDASEIVF